jgi:polyhydroxyalkanoate synthesis regulator phasin
MDRQNPSGQDQIEQIAAQARQAGREATQATQETIERAGAQARQATRESLQAAQQTGQIVAQNTERLSEQGGRVASTAFDTGWDTWLATLGAVTWTQDQAERTLRQMMDQGRVSREEGGRLLRDLVEQAKRNQAELQRLIQESVRASLQVYQNPEAMMQAMQPMATMTNAAMNPMAAMAAMMSATPTPTAGTSTTHGQGAAVSPAQFEELNRKVDELNHKLDALNLGGKTVK